MIGIAYLLLVSHFPVFFSSSLVIIALSITILPTKSFSTKRIKKETYSIWWMVIDQCFYYQYHCNDDGKEMVLNYLPYIYKGHTVHSSIFRWTSWQFLSMDYFQHRSILYIIKQSRNPRERERGKDNLTILIPFKIDFSMPGELCIQLQILPIKKKKKTLQIHFLTKLLQSRVAYSSKIISTIATTPTSAIFTVF